MSVAKAASAGAWSALDIVLRQVVGFVVAIILARLLSPEDFGVIALLAFFSTLSMVFVQGGLSIALVQRQDTNHEQENAVFWTNLLAGIFFSLILIAIAPRVARYLEFPVMDPLMYVVAAQIVLSALGAVQTSLLTRNLRFDLLTKTGVTSSVLSGVAGLAAAYGGWGVWALATQLVVQVATNSIALWVVSDWRPTWRVRFASIVHLYKFGFYMSLSSTIDILYSNGFLLVIGKLYGARDLGLLDRAGKIQALPTGIITAIIGRTVLPLFAARQGDRDALLRGLRMAVTFSMLLSLPLMAGLAVLADLVILVLLGPQWSEAAPVLAVSAIGGALLPLHVLNLQMLVASGESKTFLRLEIYKKMVGIACYGVGCFYGIMGIAWASLVFGIVAFFINAAPTRTVLGYGPLRQIMDLRGVLAVTLAMAAGVYLLRPLIDLPPEFLLAVLVAAGGAIYLGLAYLFRLDSLGTALDMVKMVMGKKRSEPATALL